MGFYRNKLKIMEYLRKRHLTKPSRGPFHGRSPSKMFKHVIRGMLPHETDRGQSAFKNLKAFEGIPAPYDKVRRSILPSCFREIKLKPNRRYLQLAVSPPRPAGSTRMSLPLLRPRERQRLNCTGRISKRRRHSRPLLQLMLLRRQPQSMLNLPSWVIERCSNLYLDTHNK